MITIRNLIQNIEKGQSSVSVKYIFQQLDQMYEGNKDLIQIVYCKQDNTGSTVYLKIPSAERPGLFFDIVFWVNSKDKIKQDTQFKVFSNSPSFAYNFSYIFNKANALLFPEKFPSAFLTMPPKVRNPLKIYSFDKHLYFGLKKLAGKNLELLNSELSTHTPPVVLTFKEMNPK
jgi:hypothetical protein